MKKIDAINSIEILLNDLLKINQNNTGEIANDLIEMGWHCSKNKMPNSNDSVVALIATGVLTCKIAITNKESSGKFKHNSDDMEVICWKEIS